ncbi:DUF6527 family protein [Reichenbachiella sp.]|uniref:DUF6527 family protein n=1 Tax=Reichenbachiella sp. TaxID=2184521 RepID=UPI003297D912
MKTLTHKFVEFIPENIQENTIYISIEYSTAVHKCCCGCGNEVITPFSPTDWSLTFNGESITLSPSIGNWNFDCRSHYFIRNNEIHWAGSWTDEEIKKGKEYDKISKEVYYNKKVKSSNPDNESRIKKWNFWKWLITKF